MSKTFIVKRYREHTNAETEEVMRDIKEGIENNFSKGSDAPGTSTPGTIYLQIGGASGGGIRTWSKDLDNNTWE